MRSKRELIHRCEFCSKHYHRPSACVRHEQHCFGNTHRLPYDGEVTLASQTGEWQDGVWVHHETMPPWWPGSPGLIYADKVGWLRVPYYAWSRGIGHAPPQEQWPGDKPLPGIKPWEYRLSSVMYYDENPATGHGWWALENGVEVVCQAQGVQHPAAGGTPQQEEVTLEPPATMG